MTVLAKSIAFTIFPALVFLCSQFLEFSYYLNFYLDSIFSVVHQENIYDFIIVGAGSAGSIIAAQLADAGKKVVLVEAGGPPPGFANIPALSPMLQQSPYDWQFKTVPQTHACKGLINNTSNWASGKVLGGSSRLNIMAYVEGHPEDFRDWFPDYNEVNAPEIPNDKLRWCSELADVIFDGVAELSSLEEYTNRLNLFMKVPVTMKDGARWSTDKLLMKERLKKRLDVITHAQVNRIIVNSNNEAEGIEFKKHNDNYVIRAKDGIIISAGAIGTPKLMMLSGIGPKDHLKELNIDVVNDLPVGKNLIDHILTGIDLVTLNSSLSVSVTEFLKPTSALNYFLFGTGPWTSTGLEAIGTLHTKLIQNLSEHPDVQLMVMPLGISQDNGAQLRKYVGISDETFAKYFSSLAHKTSITLAPVLLHPKSTGEVKLRSSNPDDDPLIDPNYLSSPEDVATLINGIMFVEELVNTKPMKTLGAEMNKQHFPGCETHKFGTWRYWECYIRHLTLTSYHPAGTCSMGSVVDQNFKVYNMQNLYIVDASVMPVLPSGNINAAVMKLASKAAKILIAAKIKKPNTPPQCHIDDLMKFIFYEEG